MGKSKKKKVSGGSPSSSSKIQASPSPAKSSLNPATVSSSSKIQASPSPAKSCLNPTTVSSDSTNLGSVKTPALANTTDLSSSKTSAQDTVKIKVSAPVEAELPRAVQNLTAQSTNPEPKTKNPESVTLLGTTDGDKSWSDMVQGNSRKLKKKGSPFMLDSGEVCVKIPNAVITKNAKSWESFIIGQFYADPPPKGAIHAIANGIWSKHQRDITVSKLDGFAYLFRVPNPATRKLILGQGLWQFEGQTMFVAKWAPGPKPVKPELTSAPVWLEFKNVPHQFWSEEGWEHIAGMVGHPILVHPATLNMTNLEVGKVLTVIDPRKPLPEGVNAQFESGEICRIEVSSPWMPPICSHCSQVGHSLRRCPSAPKTCTGCNSTTHQT